MGAEKHGSDAHLIAALNDGVQGQGDPLMELGYGLPGPGRCHSRHIARIIGGKEVLQLGRWGRRRVFERRGAVPL